MSPRSKRFLGLLAMSAVAFLAVLGTAMAMAYGAAERRFSQTFDAHAIALAVPWDGDRVAALERGRHLVTARYGCADCHGANFAGGTMIDDPLIGRVLGPNLTRGKGSRTLDYTVADWERMVRHGIKPDGRPTLMPSTDFRSMSDQELSDILTYIDSLPPVDNEVPPVTLGPLGLVFVATGTFRMTAEEIDDHHGAHLSAPPEPEDTLAFGKHLAQVCTGCHGAELRGGPIPGGPPDWPEAADLAPRGPLASYDEAQFRQTMREGLRPDGSPLRPPMTLVSGLAKNMRDEELNAMFHYLQSLPVRDAATPNP